MSCGGGPGYRTPADAIKAPKEKIVYTVLVYSGTDTSQSDALATIDVDENSPTYSQVISVLTFPYVGDELHHFGWNSCSSCCMDETKQRRFLVLPCLNSSRIYIVDTLDQRAPKLHKTIEPEEVKEKMNLSAPHTSHCLANGKIMLSMMGDKNGDAPGGFLLLSEKFEVESKWEFNKDPRFIYNYDFWYQPYLNVMISSEWAAPNTWGKGFNPAEVAEGKYGKSLVFWNWKEQTISKKFDLGSDGFIPLELRFHHNPKSSHGFVGAALGSCIFHWYQDQSKEWQVERIIKIDPVEVAGWPFPVPSLISDVLLSMDDNYIFFANWFHGDVRQYDIRDPSNPKLVGQIWLGGLIGKEAFHNGKKLEGGPQMLQLSLDGKRLYITNSLFSVWDDQFYPTIKSKGSYLIKVNVKEGGGLELDEKFYIDFSGLPNGPFRGHETRYPGGDCTSDIFLAFDD